MGRELGRGGMGAVYLARDEVLGREVAVKRIGMLPGATGPDRARAEREARLAAMLNHPHVVSVFDVVADQDDQWLIMEYVDGTSLSERIRDGGPLDHATAARTMWQVADALASAHAAGITHRDVKPSNILLTTDGQAKLTDFGIARSQTDASLTQTGLVTGSPAYLAPEVASGAGAGNASDVWSLGATLFHVLAGVPPYDVGDNLIGGLYKIVHEEPPRLSDAGRFDELLRSTMVHEPEARWSMDRVRDRLADISADPSSIGATSTQVLAVDRATSTEVLPPAPVPVPEPVPTPEAMALTPVPSSTSSTVDTEPTPARRRPLWLWLGGVAASLIAVILAVSLAGGEDPDEPAAGSTSDPTSREPTSNESSSESPTSKTPSSEPPTNTVANTRRDVTAFITTYLATVTADQRASYNMLTPGFQAASGGFGSYAGFWRTIESAEPSNIRVDPESLTVSYDVAYRTVDGAATSDSVTLQLQRTDDGYLIAGES